MSTLGLTLLQIIAVLAGAAGVAFGSSKLGQLSLLESQWSRPNGKKNCTSNGLKVTNSTKVINQVLLYGGLGLILMAFILANFGSFGFRGFSFSMGGGGYSPYSMQ